HYRNFFALIVFSRDSAGIRQTSLFVDWQCVQIGAHKHDRACAILHHAHNAETGYACLIILADTLGDLATGGFQFLGYDRSGSLLMHGDVRESVDASVERVEGLRLRGHVMTAA